MTIRRELVLDLEDIRNLSIECANCGTKVLFDIGRPNQRTPSECTSCGTRFDANLVQQPLWGLKEVFGTLMKIQHRVRIHVQTGSTESPSE
jgi:hypothetical protein